MEVSRGARLTTHLKRVFCKLKGKVELVNAYKPAETAIISRPSTVCYEKDRDEYIKDSIKDFVHLGRPLPNFLTYIVDEVRRPVPIGFQDQVYIGGPSASPGYYHHNPNKKE